MNLNLFLPLIITSIITMLGWFFLHSLTKQRDKHNKQKDLRINYLIEAWRKLEHAANRKNVDTLEYLEKPIADIQLFGTKKQIEMVQALAKEIVETENANLTELLTELRQDLRKELNLEKVLPEIKIFRAPNGNKKH